jgi:hypothetical protein
MSEAIDNSLKFEALKFKASQRSAKDGGGWVFAMTAQPGTDADSFAIAPAGQRIGVAIVFLKDDE